MGKIPWIPLKTMEHGARAKFQGFHGVSSMLSMLAWDNIPHCNSIPHESMEYKTMGTIENMETIEYKTMENHGKHGNLQK